MSLTLILIAIVVICNTVDSRDDIYDEYERPLIPHLPRERITILIHHGDEKKSFEMNPDEPTSKAYVCAANLLGIPGLGKDTVLLDDRGHIIPDDPKMWLLEALPEPTAIERHFNLHVVAVDHIAIMVDITNGVDTESFVVNAGTRGIEVYQMAVDIGIMENHYQFMLQYPYERDRVTGVLPKIADPSIPGQALLYSIDPRNPTELRLSVSPAPEGMLLHAMFRDMTPNQDIPFWNYIQFCSINPWHVLCSSLTYNLPEVIAGDISPISNQRNMQCVELEMDSVPTWSGALRLEHTPKSVQILVLKGQSVKVDFESLRFTSLRELTLDFEEVIGLNPVALSGSSLKVLRLSSRVVLSGLKVDGLLDTLAGMRARGEIELDCICFGRTKAEQKVIRYNSMAKEYVWRRRG